MKLLFLIYIMIGDFDLNINNYSIKELEDLFELPSKYNEILIEKQENKLRQNILNDITIIKQTKDKTINFINNVKKTLINNIYSNVPYNTNDKISQRLDKLYNLDKTLKKSDVINDGDTNIIKRQTTPYLQSLPSEFYEGTINPLNKRILRQNINIDTRFRDNYYATLPSNFHVDLPIKLSKVVTMELSSFEMPHTMYIVSKAFGNNFFVLEIEGENPFIVTVPDGNYDYLSFQLYINNLLFTSGTPYSDITFVVDANTPFGTGPQCGTGKMVVGSNSGTTKFSINFLTDEYGNEDRITPLPLKLGWIMGFRNGYYVNNTTYVSEGIVNLLGSRYIYLVVDDFNNNVSDGFYATFTSSILNKNILARISFLGGTFKNVSLDNQNFTTTPRQYFGPVDIQKLQIQLLDEYGRIMNLNNMDYSFCLTFETIYDL